jgi:hypothetical protein
MDSFNFVSFSQHGLWWGLNIEVHHLQWSWLFFFLFFFWGGGVSFFLESELCTRALILLEEEEEEEEEKEVGNPNSFSYTDAQRDMNVTAVDWRFRVWRMELRNSLMTHPSPERSYNTDGKLKRHMFDIIISCLWAQLQSPIVLHHLLEFIQSIV